MPKNFSINMNYGTSSTIMDEIGKWKKQQGNRLGSNGLMFNSKNETVGFFRTKDSNNDGKYDTFVYASPTGVTYTGSTNTGKVYKIDTINQQAIDKNNDGKINENELIDKNK